MSSTPNYVLTDPHDIASANTWGTKVLPAGTFVRPIHISYVPKQTIEDEKNRLFNPETEVFCYHSFGLTPIPLKKIRRV